MLYCSMKSSTICHRIKVNVKVNFSCQALPRGFGSCQTLARVLRPAVQLAAPLSFAFKEGGSEKETQTCLQKVSRFGSHFTKLRITLGGWVGGTP